MPSTAGHPSPAHDHVITQPRFASNGDIRRMNRVCALQYAIFPGRDNNVPPPTRGQTMDCVAQFLASCDANRRAAVCDRRRSGALVLHSSRETINRNEHNSERQKSLAGQFS